MARLRRYVAYMDACGCSRPGHDATTVRVWDGDISMINKIEIGIELAELIMITGKCIEAGGVYQSKCTICWENP